MHNKKLVFKGIELSEAKRALIMIHGRGASAQDILSLSDYLPVNDFALVAPEATNNTWYPHSFMAPESRNEPWLSSAINLLNETVADIIKAGLSKKDIYFLGFSQGACLTLEYVTRNASHYGGVIAFTGGLIGETINMSKYTGDFNNTPVFIGSADPDPHVPAERVHQTVEVLSKMNALADVQIYKGMGHTINEDEMKRAATLLAHKS